MCLSARETLRLWADLCVCVCCLLSVCVRVTAADASGQLRSARGRSGWWVSVSHQVDGPLGTVCARDCACLHCVLCVAGLCVVARLCYATVMRNGLCGRDSTLLTLGEWFPRVLYLQLQLVYNIHAGVVVYDKHVCRMCSPDSCTRLLILL